MCAREKYVLFELISSYFKEGEFGNARKVLEQNTERKLGSWNAVIAGSHKVDVPRKWQKCL